MESILKKISRRLFLEVIQRLFNWYFEYQIHKGLAVSKQIGVSCGLKNLRVAEDLMGALSLS